MSETDRLRDHLAASREALLAAASRVDEDALGLPTRNPAWAVRDVLAHVLASDADLISLLEAAAGTDALSGRHTSHDEHEREMQRWSEATPGAFREGLGAQARRWRALFAALPDSALALPALAWWTDAALPLAAVLEDYRTHDAEHGEDVRLALDSRAGP